MKIRITLLLIVALFSTPSLAATETVKLAVEGMTCAACPITVKVALNKVEGVSQVEVSYPEREAVVTFDNTQTSVEALTKATSNAGYPSTVKLSETNQE
jgi:mercuric ion binding protein